MAIFLPLILIILMSSLVVGKSPNFFDYDNYDDMLETGSYVLRYQQEPISMVMMYLSTFLDEGAFGFYLIVWVLYLLSVVYLSLRYYAHIWFTASTFLLFNPLSIMAFLTPRHFLSLTLILLAIHLTRIRALLVLGSSVLAHFVLGVFALFFVRLQKYSNFISFLLMFFGVASFYIFMVEMYPQLMEKGLDQGRGQAIYGLIFLFIYYLVMFRKSVKFGFYITSYFFILILYLINPIAYRFFSLWIIMAFLYMVSNLKKKDSFLIIRGFTFLSVGLSAFIVMTGMYGYGPQ